jgi:putative Holliday junction resolvase
MRFGRRLAVDVGKVRIGLAISDPHGILASPLSNVPRLPTLEETMVALKTAVAEYEILEIYVGLPSSLAGRETASTRDAIDFAMYLQKSEIAEVRFIDERLTSVSANQILRAAGKNSKQSRHVVDQVAATIILEQALELERKSTVQPGKSVIEFENE